MSLFLKHVLFTVTWIRNGEAIDASDKHEMRDQGDAHTMQVNRCHAGDTGSYKVVVETQEGESVMSDFTLTVLPRQYQAARQMRQKFVLMYFEYFDNFVRSY